MKNTPALQIRPDAQAKLGGNPGYPSDRVREDQLHGAILRSPHPHSGIASIDTSAASALPGVHAVVTHADIAGASRYGLRGVDRPVLCSRRALHRRSGAAVAAETRSLAQQALALIRVDYARLPLVDDAECALALDCTPLHECGNLLHHTVHRRGDAEAARASCAHVVEAVCETPRQMHAYLETEGGVVGPDGQGGWVVHFGWHNPERDRQFIAAMLALPPSGSGSWARRSVAPVAARTSSRCSRLQHCSPGKPAARCACTLNARNRSTWA